MKNNVDFEHIDLISVKPLDSNTILKSVKTGRLLVLDTGFKTNSVHLKS